LFDHVSFQYPGASALSLDDVSFAICQGQRVALMGANGSGKSTLTRLANGLLLPMAGAVSIDGLSTSKRDDLRMIRQHCGVVAQDPDTQIVCTTVFDEVAFGPQNLKLKPAEIHARIEAALTAVGLEALRERDPNTLSGGEKQRLVIAGVMAMQPRYVVFDEPSSMLDSQGRREVLMAIHDLQCAGHGILHITHRLEEAFTADEIIILEAGRIVFHDTRAVFEQREDLIAQFRIEALGAREPRKPIFSASSGLSELMLEDASLEPLKPAPSASSGLSELVLEDVSYTYGMKTSFEHQALENVSLTITPGSMTLIAGHTGSGKSTLLRIAAGLLEPTKGSAFIKIANQNSKLEGIMPSGSASPSDPVSSSGSASPTNSASPSGKKPPSDTPATMRIEPGTVGLVFQNPESQLFAATVFDDIAFGPKNIGLATTAEDTRQIVQSACALVGLDFERFAHRSPFTLSGGEARRVALAGILAMSPRFLLLDEPTAGLDAQGHRFFFELINNMRAQGIGVVVVSHEVDLFAPQADAVVALEQGRRVPWP